MSIQGKGGAKSLMNMSIVVKADTKRFYVSASIHSHNIYYLNSVIVEYRICIDESCNLHSRQSDHSYRILFACCE